MNSLKNNNKYIYVSVYKRIQILKRYYYYNYNYYKCCYYYYYYYLQRVMLHVIFCLIVLLQN